MNTHSALETISKLNRETKEDRVVWQVNRSIPSSLLGTEELMDNVYMTKVLEKYLRLYKLQVKYYFDEGAYEWTENFRLEFTDERGNSIWRFPDDRSIIDLYETVTYKTSGAEKFFSDFLKGNN